MSKLTISSWLLLAGLAITFAGCSSSDEPPAADPAKAKQRVAQGNQIMVPKLGLLILSHGTDTSAYDMSGAHALYAEALAADPNNLDAHFGYSATEIIGLNKDPQVRSIFLGSLGTVMPVTAVLSGKATPRQISTMTLKASDFMPESGPLPMNPGVLVGKYLQRSSSAPFSATQAIIETKLLPPLADAIAHLQRIAQDPNWAYYITSRDAGQELTDSVRIDLTEVYFLTAICQGISAEGSFLVAYDVDYDNTTAAAVTSAWTVSSTFLAFRPQGALRMQNTKSFTVSAATSVQQGINFLMNETPHPGVELIPYNPSDGPSLQATVHELDTLKMLFTSPITVQGDFNHDGIPDNLTLSLASFFDNAVPNFKAKLPAYTVTAEPTGFGTYAAVITWQATSFSSWTFPDPTLNGFLPGMTDASFKATFGLARGWTRTWIP